MEYGLIGEHLGHSFSKEIHETIGSYKYELKELAPSELTDFFITKRFKAINVTIPYKEKVIPFLYYEDEAVKEIKACNVIVNKDGRLYGYNSDALGFKKMLEHFKIDVNNQKVLVFGTGGTSKTVCYVLKSLNAKEILVFSRNKSENNLSYDELNEHLDASIVINTTPVGMYPNNDNKIASLDNFSNLKAVVDVIYNPIRTNFTLQRKDVISCNGLYMLVAQAFYAIEIFKDIKLDESLIDKTYEKILKEKENIVLIGMPGSGKSTLAKELAKKLNKKIIDTDERIKKIIKMPISDYFAANGEDKFREIETKVILEVSKLNGYIIATGGGSILKDENVNALKQNGKLYFIDRPLEKLKYSDSRPLSSTFEAVSKLYEERYDRYVACADEHIIANISIEDTANKILRSLDK